MEHTKCDLMGCIDHLARTVSSMRSSSTPRGALQSNIDLEDTAARLDVIAREMRTLRNASLPIMQLPEEILVMILMMVQGDLFSSHDARRAVLATNGNTINFPLPLTALSRIPYTTAAGYRSPYRWMKIMHVCMHWRNIAQSASCLWDTIVIERETPFAANVKRPALQTLLDRSGPRQLLNVVIHDVSTPAAADILSNIHRLKQLRLEGVINGVKASPLRRPAPNLKILDLRQMSIQGQPTAKWHSTLFGGELPLLESLSLPTAAEFLAFKLKMPKLHQLHLTAFTSNYADGSGVPQSLPVFLASFKRLEDLALTNSTTIRFLPVGFHRRVNMRKLKRLVYTRVTGIGELISCLELSRPLSLTCISPVYSPFSAGTLQHDVSIMKDLDIFQRFQLHFHHDSWALRSVGSASALRMAPFSLFEPSMDPLADIMASLMQNVHELWLSGDAPLCRNPLAMDQIPRGYVHLVEFLRDILSLAAAPVQQLYLMSGDETIQSECLARLTSYCPKLRSLYIRVLAETSYIVHDLLPQVLQRRMEQGCPIEMVTVHLPNITYETPGIPHVDQPEWKADLERVCTPYVESMIILEDLVLPRMELVPICQSRSTRAGDSPIWSWGDDPVDDFSLGQS